MHNRIPDYAILANPHAMPHHRRIHHTILQDAPITHHGVSETCIDEFGWWQVALACVDGKLCARMWGVECGWVSTGKSEFTTKEYNTPRYIKHTTPRYSSSNTTHTLGSNKLKLFSSCAICRLASKKSLIELPRSTQYPLCT